MSTLLLFNKPFQVLSQFTDDQDRATLSAYIDTKGVYPAGRLDYDSEGLLLLTGDGQLQDRISNPQHKLPKTYWVQVEGQPLEQDLQALRQGIELKDGPCRPAQVKIIAAPTELWPRTPPIRERKQIADSWLEMTISEGRNRQVRRMTAAIGFPTLRLIRMSIGNWSVRGIAPGSFRTLQVHAPSARPKSSAAKSSANRRSGKQPHRL